LINDTFPYFKKLDLNAMASWFSVMPHVDITPHLSRIIVPVCLIAGDRDPIVPPKESNMMAEKITNARLIAIKGAGHLPIFEKPMEYQKAIDGWLTEFQSLVHWELP